MPDVASTFQPRLASSGPFLTEGGGGGGVPLTAAMFVDPGTAVPAPDQTGSAVAPFSTLQAAIDALPVGGGSLLLTPGAYPNEEINVTKSISLIGLAAGLGYPETLLAPSADLSICNLTTSGDLSLVDLVVNDATAGGQLTIDGCKVNGDCTAGAGMVVRRSEIEFFSAVESVYGYESKFSHGGTAAGSFFSDCTLALLGEFLYNFTSGGGASAFRNCQIDAQTTCNDLQAWDCVFTATVSGFGTVELWNVSGGNQVNAGVSLKANGCSVAGIAIGAAGTSTLTATTYNELTGPVGSIVDCDAFSNRAAPAIGGLVKNQVAARASLVVTVPVLAANAIGSAAQALTGTVLEGLLVDRQVVANEPTAGVAGGGFLAGVRVTSTNNVTFTFHGPTTGGNQTFIVTEI